jgi:hypothetical protein
MIVCTNFFELCYAFLKKPSFSCDSENIYRFKKPITRRKPFNLLKEANYHTTQFFGK